MPSLTDYYNDDAFFEREIQRMRQELMSAQLWADTMARSWVDNIRVEDWEQRVASVNAWAGSTFTSRKPTVEEKVKEMWERSSYYKMMKTREASLIKPKRNNKPFYRAFERWCARS